MNKQSSDIFIKNFEQHLEKTIGIVAVMRLAIDPFPVLLMDEEIMYRYFDSLTEPYSFDFVNKYIGEETLNFYKMTDLYKQTYESIIVEEKKCESVYEIMKYNLIDTTKADEIIPQLHLLSRKAIICTLITLSNKKVLSVTDEFRFPIYVSDRQKYRTSITWSFELVNEFSKIDDVFNKEYNLVYISRFDYDGIYYIEHSEPFDNEDISYMSGLVLGAIFSMNENAEDK